MYLILDQMYLVQVTTRLFDLPVLIATGQGLTLQSMSPSVKI